MKKQYLIIILILLSVTFSKEYSRIISLAPSFTKQLYLLGAEDKLIANTTYCNTPKEAESKEKIGNLIQVNIEKIVQLKPDLVLATSMTKPKLLDKLRNLGIEVKLVKTARNFDEICEQLISIGKYSEQKENAEKIVEKLKRDIETIKLKIQKIKRKTVFMQIGTDPLFAVIKGTFVDDIISLAGGKNIVEQTNTGIYSREKVIEKNPEYIIISTMGIIGEKEKKVWKKYSSLEAVKNNNIFIVSSNIYLSPGPFQFVEAVKDLLKILHENVEIEN